METTFDETPLLLKGQTRFSPKAYAQNPRYSTGMATIRKQNAKASTNFGRPYTNTKATLHSNITRKTTAVQTTKRNPPVTETVKARKSKTGVVFS